MRPQREDRKGKGRMKADKNDVRTDSKDQSSTVQSLLEAYSGPLGTSLAAVTEARCS